MTKPTNKNSIYITIALLFVAITTSTLIFLIISIKKYEINTNSKIIKNDEKNYKYLAKDINGKINIFKNDNVNPEMILEKPTIFLPEFDRKMLANGIYLNNINELNSLMEDYDD